MKRHFIYMTIAAVQLAALTLVVSGFAMAPIDPKVGNFGSPKLDPALKDGMGYISKVALVPAVPRQEIGA